MLSDYIKIGDRVEICLKRDKAVAKPHLSLVANKINNTSIVLDAPISFGQIVVMRPGDGYWLLFFTENGICGFDAKIESYFKEDGFNLVKVSLASKGEKIQRRDFYRYECTMPIKFSIIDKENEVKKEAGKPNLTILEGLVKDISGGGIRFVANENISEARSIKCAFMLDEDIIAANGKILHKEQILSGAYKFQYRIQFTKISVDDQENIVKYIFLQQRKALGRI